MSPAWKHLRTLQVGEFVPERLYVLDYRDGLRPRWQVAEVEELESGGRSLLLIDRDNGAEDLFGPRAPVALQVITHPNKTLRTQPYMLGSDPLPMLCDLDQQGRHVGNVVV